MNLYTCIFAFCAALIIVVLLICYAQVVNIHLPVDRETGTRKPFGFVEFDTEAEADQALDTTQHNIAGREVSSAVECICVLDAWNVSCYRSAVRVMHSVIMLHPRDDKSSPDHRDGFVVVFLRDAHETV